MMENEKELNADGQNKENPSVTPEKGEEQVSTSPETKEVEAAADETPANDSENKNESAPTPDAKEETADVSPATNLATTEVEEDKAPAVATRDSEEETSNKVETTEKEEQTPEASSAEVESQDSDSKEDKSVETNALDEETQKAPAEAPIAENKEETSVETTTEKVEPQASEEKLDSEEDLKEKQDEEEHHEEEEEVDYSTFDKKQLVEAIRELSQSGNFINAEKKARIIKPFFDEIKNAERQIALDKFIAEGGEEGDFYFKHDELTDRFEANYRLIHDNKVNYVRDLEGRKEDNLKKKQDILERLREFVDSEETNIQFDAFKAIQDEWKAVGPVPGPHVRTLWANYNALVDRFFDNRHIYFELKELDRKKNLESKVKLCEKAEALAKIENVSEAIKELNELHHEYKHIGPVPNGEREALWQRFKGASDAVYDRRKEFVDGLKEELEANLVVKEELVTKVKQFIDFDSEKIKDWNTKTKELQELQEKWEAVGGLPSAKAKEVNKAFWSSFKTFFHN